MIVECVCERRVEAGSQAPRKAMPAWVGAPLSKVGIEDEKPLRGSCGVGVGACAGKAHQTCHIRGASTWEWSVGRGSSLSLDVDVGSVSR